MPGSLGGAIELRPDQFKADYDPNIQLSTDPSSMLGQPLDLLSQMLIQLPQLAMKAIADLLSDPGRLADLLLQFPNAGLDALAGWAGTIPGIGPLVEAIIGSVGDLLDLSNWFGNLELFLGGGVDFGSLLFDPITAVGSFITSMLQPSGLLATLVGGLIPGLQIGGLDASKIVSGFFPMSMITGLTSTFLGSLAAIVNGIFGAGAATATTPEDAMVEAEEAVASLNGRVVTLEGGGTLTTYTVSATWTNPSPTEHVLITVICVCGGQGGAMGEVEGAGNTWHAGAPGGRSGGYVSRDLYTDELPATVAMTIGAGGAGSGTQATPGAIGGATTFGSFVTGTPGLGAVYRDNGSYAVAVPPGDGGTGGTADNNNHIFNSPEWGKSGPFAVGGYPTPAGTSGPGAAAPAGIPSGGGGGAGGGDGNGGNGGFPGGGGGGGGINGITAFNLFPGGNGAAGCIYVAIPD